MDGRLPCSEHTSKPRTRNAAFFGGFGLSDDVFGEPAAASNSSNSCASSSPVEGAGGGSTTGSSSTGGSGGGGAGVSSTVSALGGIASPQNSHVPLFVGRFSNMQTGHSHFSPSSAIFVRGGRGGGCLGRGRVGCLFFPAGLRGGVRSPWCAARAVARPGATTDERGVFAWCAARLRFAKPRLDYLAACKTLAMSPHVSGLLGATTRARASHVPERSSP
jgi:hypothetical protein